MIPTLPIGILRGTSLVLESFLRWISSGFPGENRKVTFVEEQQSYSDHPDRFTNRFQVLSRESLTGRCYWEVEIRGGWWFGVAVTYKSIRRDGGSEDSGLGLNDKSWMLDCDTNSYQFYHNSIQTPASGPRSSRVGVYLDHRAGVLSFYSVSETMNLLHRVQTSFTQPLHAGVRLYYYYGDSAEFMNLRQSEVVSGTLG
ncbi:tripartite motif-containing protein 14-like [Pempheris klunzingeri]|uniref:tripartite motif-containing protein 14-like n=1 Tax=Pempheris klunzingeri TaxID=3127111 RepID=UPI00397EEFA0